MNSSIDVACNFLELKTPVAVLPGYCRGGTTAALTKVSAVDAGLLPLSVLLDVTPACALKGSKAGLTAGTQHNQPLCQLEHFL